MAFFPEETTARFCPVAWLLEVLVVFPTCFVEARFSSLTASGCLQT